MDYEVKDFQTDVIDASYTMPVVVDFWAEWCGPCKMLGPVLEKLARENQGKWKLVKVDTDANQELAMTFGIRSIPSVKMFVNGDVADEFAGALPEKKITEFLAKHLPPPAATPIDLAVSMMNAGDESHAARMLESALTTEQAGEAKILLAKLSIFDNPARAEELLQSAGDVKGYYDLSEALNEILAQTKLSEAGFPEAEVKPAYIRAVEAARTKKFDAALEALIQIIRDDRYYLNDAARKLCVAIFKYLGEEHPVTVKHRRDFGRALYV